MINGVPNDVWLRAQVKAYLARRPRGTTAKQLVVLDALRYRLVRNLINDIEAEGPEDLDVKLNQLLLRRSEP